jgi:hypothetical protein
VPVGRGVGKAAKQKCLIINLNLIKRHLNFKLKKNARMSNFYSKIRYIENAINT